MDVASSRSTEEQTVYLKSEKNVLIHKRQVEIGDIVKLYGTDKKLIGKLNKRQIFVVDADKKAKYVVSILKVIEAISSENNALSLVNLGESDIIVEYEPQKMKSKAWEIIKTAIVCLIVFSGSIFTIMTFNEDVSVEKIFGIIEEMVLGKGNNSNGLLQLSYSIGLPIGIIVFFNHFSKLRADNDPTPLEVQIKLYEENAGKAIINNISRENKVIDAE